MEAHSDSEDDAASDMMRRVLKTKRTMTLPILRAAVCLTT